MVFLVHVRQPVYIVKTLASSFLGIYAICGVSCLLGHRNACSNGKYALAYALYYRGWVGLRRALKEIYRWLLPSNIFYVHP